MKKACREELFDDIKVILWDIDGTVLNFVKAQENAINSCFAKFNLGKCTAEMHSDYDAVNHKYWEALERGELTKPEVLRGRFEEFFSMYGIDTAIVDDFNSEYQVRLGDTIVFYPGVMQLMNELKEERFIQFAVSNGTKRAQTDKLEKSGLNKIFDRIFISEDVGYEKPSMLFFDAVYEEAKKYFPGLTPGEMLIIGDSLTSDMKLGRDAGMRTCLFADMGDEPKSMPARDPGDCRDNPEKAYGTFSIAEEMGKYDKKRPLGRIKAVREASLKDSADEIVCKNDIININYAIWDYDDLLSQ